MKLRPTILIFLIISAAFSFSGRSAEIKSHDLFCSHYLENLTRGQSRYRDAFWKAAEPPPEEVRGETETMAAWQLRLLAKTQSLLHSLKVDHEEVELEGNVKALRLIGRREGTKLNEFVYEMEKWMGVEFVYAPLYLMKENGKFSRARYNRSKNRIYLSHEFVDGVQADESLHHEVLHAVFSWFRANHVDSLFHGEVKSTDEDWDLWETQSYARHMSFEELGTLPVNLVLFAKGLERLEADGNLLTEDGRNFIKDVRRKAEILNGISAESRSLLKDIRKAIRDEADDSGIEFLTKNLPPSKLGEVSVGWAILHWEHNRVRLPLVTDDLIHEVAQYEAAEGREKVNLEKRLTAHVMNRLKEVERIGKTLEEQTDTILNELDAVIARLDDGRTPTKAQIREVVKSLKGPRELTLPYLNSLDGEPPRSGPASKLPLPEKGF